MLVVVHHTFDGLNRVAAGQEKGLDLHHNERAVLHLLGVSHAAPDLQLLEREAERRLRDLLGVDEDLHASVVDGLVLSAPAPAVAAAAAAAKPAAAAFSWTAAATATGTACESATTALARATSCLHDATAGLRCVLGTLGVCGVGVLFALRQRSPPAKASPRAAVLRRRMDVHHEVDPRIRDDAPAERIDLRASPTPNSESRLVPMHWQ